jgi:hypothetical protein
MEWILQLAVVAAIMGGINWFGRRRAKSRLRAAYSRAFDPKEKAELDEHVALVRGVLSHVSAAPLVPPSGPIDDAWLSAAVAIAAERFGVPAAQVTWRFISDPLVPNSAGCVWGDGGSMIRHDGDQYVVSAASPSRNWTIEVANRYRVDREVAFVIVGHEMAHIALLSHQVRLEPRRRNEELTDVAAFLAGFGATMRDIARRETWRENGRRIELRVGDVGYLHRDAIEYLHAAYLAPTNETDRRRSLRVKQGWTLEERLRAACRPSRRLR